jgi:hypothetical protein
MTLDLRVGDLVRLKPARIESIDPLGYIKVGITCRDGTISPDEVEEILERRETFEEEVVRLRQEKAELTEKYLELKHKMDGLDK